MTKNYSSQIKRHQPFTPKLKLIIFGAAEMAEKMLPFINTKKATILAFIDERSHRQNETFHGLPIIGLEMLNSFEFDGLLIAVGQSLLVRERLILEGILPNKLILFNFREIANSMVTCSKSLNSSFSDYCLDYINADSVLVNCFLTQRFLQDDWFKETAVQWNTSWENMESVRNELLELPVTKTALVEKIVEVFALSPDEIIQNLQVLRIETTNKCSYNCFFCGAKKMKRPKGTMSDTDFTTLIEQLSDLYNFNGLILLHHSGEPLLDKTIISKIGKIHKKFPFATIGLNSTLGVSLSTEELDALWEQGLKALCISFYGFSPEQYRQIHGVDQYHVALKNLQHMLQSPVRLRKNGRIIARILDLTGHVGTDSDSYLQKKEDFKTELRQYHGITIRDAYLMSYAGKGFTKKRATNLPCDVVWGNYRRELNITRDWNVVPCCLDADNGVVLGNLRNQSLEDIFASELYKHFTYAHWYGNLQDYPLCALCERHIKGKYSELLILAAWKIQVILHSDGCPEQFFYTVLGDPAIVPSLVEILKKQNFGYMPVHELLYPCSYPTGDQQPTLAYVFIVTQADSQYAFAQYAEKLFAKTDLAITTKIIPIIGAGYLEPTADVEALCRKYFSHNLFET